MLKGVIEQPTTSQPATNHQPAKGNTGLDLYVVGISIKFSTLVTFRHVGNIP